VSRAGPTFALVIATHNRKEKLERSLRCALRSFEAAGVSPEILVFDAGCEDGTSEMLAESWPQTLVISGHRGHYWAESVRELLRVALQLRPQVDNILHLNDDVELMPHAVNEWLHARDSHSSLRLAVGVVARRGNHSDVFSPGFLLGRIVRLRYRWLSVSDQLQWCDTVSGNVLFFTRVAAETALSTNYTHGYLDATTGLLTSRSGAKSVAQLPGVLAEADEPSPSSAAAAAAVAASSHPIWQLRHHPKSPPLREAFAYARSVGGWSSVAALLGWYRRLPHAWVSHRFRE